MLGFERICEMGFACESVSCIRPPLCHILNSLIYPSPHYALCPLPSQSESNDYLSGGSTKRGGVSQKAAEKTRSLEIVKEYVESVI